MGTFLVDHPGHGGDAHQGRNQNEEHRKYPGDTRHNIRGAVQIVIAHVAVPVQNDQIRRIHRVNFIPGIQQLFLRVLQFRFGVCQFLFGILFRLLVFLPAILQFLFSLFPLAPANVNFLFRVVQLGLIGPHFLLALVDLRLCVRKLLLGGGLLAFQRGIAGLDCRHGIRNLKDLLGLRIGTAARTQLRVQSLVLQPQHVDLFLDARLFLFRRFFQTGRKGFNSAFILRDHTGQGFISGGKFCRRRDLILHLLIRT